MKHRMIRRLVLGLVVAALWVHARPATAAEPDLKKADRVAIVGDSITEQKLYSKFMETYLLVCVPEFDLNVIQLGWSGERAPGFAARMHNDLMPWKPTVVTTCYGMNDGGYRKYEPRIGAVYEKAMRDIVTRLKKAGVTVIVGSPSPVDIDTFRGKPTSIYNDNLAQLALIAKKIAADNGMPFADVNTILMETMKKAKAQYGPKYIVCGHDGVHPGPNGHLVMAYAFLKAMGLDGNIGTFTVAWGGKAEASPGHKLLSWKAGAAAEALEYLRRVAETSIDFDEAERERTVRDGGLGEQYRLTLPASTGNLYIMPSGRLIDADDTIYRPTVIAENAAENAAETFGDWPGDEQEP